MELGGLMTNLPQHDKVDVRILERVLGDQFISLSYKIFWFKSLIGFVSKGESVLRFQDIVYDMIASAWYMVTEYKLKLGYEDNLYKIIEYISDTYKIPSTETKANIINFLNTVNDKEINKKVNVLFIYVPYRFISPFYELILRGAKESSKNLTIVNLSYNDDRAIYRINLEKKEVIINGIWMEYIKENYNVLLGWTNYKLINYLQKKNPNIPAIPFKLEPPYERNLATAKKYWNEIGNKMTLMDIYIGEEFTQENISKYGVMSIDHFIPWSFIMHDEMWNLLPSFKNINSSKSNLLPDMDSCFGRFCDLQYDAYKIASNNKGLSKILEDYLNIYTKEIDLNAAYNYKITKDEFQNCMRNTIYPLHQIAYNQGFAIWKA